MALIDNKRPAPRLYFWLLLLGVTWIVNFFLFFFGLYQPTQAISTYITSSPAPM